MMHQDENGAETFSLTPEQALVFTREGQPACMQGFIQAVVCTTWATRSAPRATSARP